MGTCCNIILASLIEARRDAELLRQLSQQLGGSEDHPGLAKHDPAAILHSDEALAELCWPQWDQRRAACSARFAAKTAELQQPIALADVLVRRRSVADGVSTRARSAAEFVEPVLQTTRSGRHSDGLAFSSWAPRVLNRVAKSHAAIFTHCEHGPPPERRRPPVAQHGTAPSDEFAIQRAAWYAELAEQYAATGEWVDDAGAAVVWTDGGCADLGDGRIAGSGIFYGAANPLNRSLPVDGPQTSVRAELSALLYVLETDLRPLNIRSDCRVVVDGFNIHRAKNRAKAWLRKPLDARPIANDDLWRRADRAARRREALRVPTTVRWCRGHAYRTHVERGETTELDAYSNMMADELATAARRAAAVMKS